MRNKMSDQNFQQTNTVTETLDQKILRLQGEIKNEIRNKLSFLLPY